MKLFSSIDTCTAPFSYTQNPFDFNALGESMKPKVSAAVDAWGQQDTWASQQITRSILPKVSADVRVVNLLSGSRNQDTIRALDAIYAESPKEYQQGVANYFSALFDKVKYDILQRHLAIFGPGPFSRQNTYDVLLKMGVEKETAKKTAYGSHIGAFFGGAKDHKYSLDIDPKKAYEIIHDTIDTGIVRKESPSKEEIIKILKTLVDTYGTHGFLDEKGVDRFIADKKAAAKKSEQEKTAEQSILSAAWDWAVGIVSAIPKAFDIGLAAFANEGELKLLLQLFDGKASLQDLLNFYFGGFPIFFKKPKDLIEFLEKFEAFVSKKT